MSERQWSRLGGRRFNFSALKGGGKEYMIAGVLGLVILGAVYMIWTGMSPPEASGALTEVMCWCDPNGSPKGCGNEFLVQVKDLPHARNSGEQAEAMRVNCPKCNGQKTCWQETQCPNCKKWFVALSTRIKYDALRRRMGEPTGVRDLCFWCKTDITKWNAEHAPKD